MRPPLKPGQVIGKYRVVRLIAMGGMGAVYEVLHLGLERRDALKAMLPEFAALPELRARFIREAKVTNRVRHPGIVQIYEISELEDGSPYFVMEYIDGETLAQRMEKLRQRPGQHSSIIDLAPLRQVASILASCHDKGLIHRDLKPGNIMLVKDSDVAGGERAKLLDFGIVKIQKDAQDSSPKPVTEPQTQAGLLLGTPEYMAPEQWGSGQPITEKVDVYALGVMAYRMLGGCLPFVADTPIALGMLHLSRPPLPLRERNAQLPIELCILIDRMLAKDARQRPSISEFVSTLGRMGDRSNYSELRSGQLIIPESESGLQPIPPELYASGTKPVPQALRVNVQPAAAPANAAPPPVKSSFVPSSRPALPESTTARGSEPAPGNLAVDFSSSQLPLPQQLATPGTQLYVADEIPAAGSSAKWPSGNLPAANARPTSSLWRWLGVIGSLLLSGLLITKCIRPMPTDAQPDAQLAGDLAIIEVQPDGLLAELGVVPDLAGPSVDLRLPGDMAAAAPDMFKDSPSHRSNPDMGKLTPKKLVRRVVDIHCIASRDIPSEQQKLIVESFRQSGVLLALGERVTIVNGDGRPHVEQMPPPLLDLRQGLEYALRGLFLHGFPKLVVIECRAPK